MCAFFRVCFPNKEWEVFQFSFGGWVTLHGWCWVCYAVNRGVAAMGSVGLGGAVFNDSPE